MKGKAASYFVLIFLLFSVLLLGFSNAGTLWSFQNVHPTANAYYPSLALDSNGNPHISYYDATPTKAALTYASLSGSAWTYLTLPSTTNVSYNDLALDSNGNPHISYYEATKGDLMYASWNGANWTNQTVDSTGNVGYFNSLALNSNGYPSISYCDPDKGDLKYANWTGSIWNISTVDSTGDVGYFTSLALDSYGNPHISYRDGTKGDLKYASWNGANWNFLTPDPTTDDVGRDTSLALDANGNPHISYLDVTNGHLKYASLIGTVWTIQIVDSTTDVGLYSSLALDSNGYPHISYYDATKGNLKYARWNGEAWITQAVDSTGDVGYSTSLALNSNGYPRISYRDGTKGVLKYASGQAAPPTGSIDVNGGNIYTTSKSVTLSLTYSATGASVKDVRFSNDGVWDTETWETPVASEAWILTSGDGPKTVYYQVRDDDLMPSSVYSGNIILDTTPPSGSIVINSGGSSTSSTLVTLTISATDETSGVAQMGFSNDGSNYIWQAIGSSASWTLPGGYGPKTVYAKFIDNAGLPSTTPSSKIIDLIPSPTPPPTSTPTPTPTPSPKPTSTPTPTPTPSPKPTSTPTPTPTPTLGGGEISLVVVGIVVAVIAGVTFALLFLLIFRKRKPKPKESVHPISSPPPVVPVLPVEPLGPPVAKPTRLRISAEPLSIVADGASKSALTLQLLDKEGKPAATAKDLLVKIYATQGKLAQPTVTIPKGASEAKTFITASTQKGSALVSASVEGLSKGEVALNFKEEEQHCLYCGALTPSMNEPCPECGRIPP